MKSAQGSKEYILNFVAIVLLCISLGTGFFLEFFLEQKPCILCFLQRISMIGIGAGLYLNLSIVMTARHYGISLVWALLGLAVALRHNAHNFCLSNEEKGFLFFSHPIYVWSFLTFFLSILGIGILLCCHSVDRENGCFKSGQEKRSPLVLIAAFLLLSTLAFGFFSVFHRLGWQLLGL
jgi:disulfide bond formation protein DsbB